MNRREIKKLIYRNLAFFLNSLHQDWSSVPDWFYHLKIQIFKDVNNPTRAEDLRYESVLTEVMTEFLNRGEK